MDNNRFHEIFMDKPILGMIHLAGEDPIKQALEELTIFEEEGVDGAIIENYCGTIKNVNDTIKEISKRSFKVTIGINILPNEFHLSLPLAREYGADFVQLDFVSGRYEGVKDFNFNKYRDIKSNYSDIVVLGGVHPKYYTPIEGSDLKDDLEIGVQRAEAIVVTGEGTGMKTPLDKIKEFRNTIGDYPLIVGAGLTTETVYEQLSIADGAIVGTSLKIDDNTINPINRQKVRNFMNEVKRLRKDIK
tara:strand:+ start:601 stop:1338 length:738 start_codon:yes stop_codon:yes gene_type:complete